MVSRVQGVVWLAVVLGATAFIASVFAQGPQASSYNMRLVANYGGEKETPYRVGTDLAFWGDLLVAGKLDQGPGPNASPPGGFRLLDIEDPTQPQLKGQFTCLGDQSDVSVWKDLVILSVDKPTQEYCTAERTVEKEGSSIFEGLRIVSIADPKNPELIKTVSTKCGSHTNTIFHDKANKRLLVYVLSYPLAGRYNPADKLPTCNAESHRRFSVVEVKLDDPKSAAVISEPMVETNIGCHDVTLFLERRVAAAACLTESQIWSLADPANPTVIARIPNPAGMNLSHSTTFSNDGRTLVIGDELGGAAASPGCVSNDKRFAPGGLFFFDVMGSKLSAPELVGTYKLPRSQISAFCTAHLFNVVPMRGNRDVLVSSWYTGSTSVIDFTDPRNPREIAHHVPRDAQPPDPEGTDAAGWAAYWYNGYVYSSNFDEDVNSGFAMSRGLDVLSLDIASIQREAVRLHHLNPQVQEPLPPAPKRPRKKR